MKVLFLSTLLFVNLYSNPVTDLTNYVHKGVELVKMSGDYSILDNHRVDYMYMFCYDINGTNLYHGAKKLLEGKNLYKLQDRRGKLLIMQMSEAMKRRSSSWHSYYWSKLDKNGKIIKDEMGEEKVFVKLSYINKVNETEYCGSGLYLRDMLGRLF